MAVTVNPTGTIEVRGSRGGFTEKTLNILIVGQSATDDYIDTGGEYVYAVTGFATYASTGVAPIFSIVLNADGTGSAEGSRNGSIGIESSQASTGVALTCLIR